MVIHQKYKLKVFTKLVGNTSAEIAVLYSVKWFVFILINICKNKILSGKLNKFSIIKIKN